MTASCFSFTLHPDSASPSNLFSDLLRLSKDRDALQVVKPSQKLLVKPHLMKLMQLDTGTPRIYKAVQGTYSVSETHKKF